MSDALARGDLLRGQRGLELFLGDLPTGHQDLAELALLGQISGVVGLFDLRPGDLTGVGANGFGDLS